MKSEYVLVAVFAVIALAVTATWVMLALSGEEIPPGVTALLTAIVSSCLGLAYKAKGVSHE